MKLLKAIWQSFLHRFEERPIPPVPEGGNMIGVIKS